LSIEGKTGSSNGLGLIDSETILLPEKQLKNVSGQLSLNGKTVSVSGYEIHAGVTQVNESQPITLDNNESDGVISKCGHIFGSYLHGIFEESEAMQLILNCSKSKR
jgi:adenosylcobyric acid synthase